MSTYPIENREAAEAFLLEFASMTRRRALSDLKPGAVQDIVPDEDGKGFSAVVQERKLYRTEVFEEDGGWNSVCSCSSVNYCKHAYALMHHLLGKGGEKRLPSAAAKSDPAVSLRQDLAAVMMKTLGRQLSSEESRFAAQVQKLFRDYGQAGFLQGWRLQPLTGSYGDTWEYLRCWPEKTRDVVEFWHGLEHALRLRNAAIPGFMKGLAKAHPPSEKMVAFRRNEEIARWNSWLQKFSAEPELPSMEPVEFRLVLAPDLAVLEWRKERDASFRVLKQKDFKELSEKYRNGLLGMGAESSLVWQPIYQYLNYDYRRFSYGDSSFCRLLNQLLRAPLSSERVLTGWRTPFIRSDQPLKWELVHNSASESYSLRLVNDHGVQPAEPFLTLPGQPALYVTEECIYQGPTPLREELARSVQSIPAPVLEQQKGVEFIDRLGVPLPSHLAGRTRKCPYKVRLECRLNSASGRDEALEIRVLASPEGHPQVEEFFSATGWQKTDKTGSPPKDEGIIYLFDRSAMNEFPSAFDLLNPKWDFFHNIWHLKISKTFPERFTAWLESLPARFELSLDSELQTLQSSPVSARINLNCEEAGIDWFDIRVVLDVSDTELTQEELNLLLSAQGRHVRLGNKGWRKLEFILSEEEDATLARLGLNASDFNAEPQRLHALQLADKSASRFLPEPQVEALQRRVDELKTRVSPPLPRVIQAELRPYQVEGFHFLAYLTENRFGGILADDMGLGKTVQTLTWLAWLREQTPGAASSLVVCPKSVADNWRAEAERFYPGLRVQVWSPGMAESELDPSRFDLLVINYVQLRALQDALAPRSWQAVILDEGQYIKNPNSQTARSARALKADHRLVLSGTPIENRLLDLWSLMAFAMPGVLGNRNAFVRQFDRKGDPYGRLRLSARVRPFLLRRTKDQVAGDLPDRIEEDLYCELESEQMTLYRAELKRAQQMLLSVKTQKELDQQRFHFLTSLLRLRQICCHPGLVSETAANASSAKMETLLELLEPIMEEGHKVLVFSQFVTLLEILREAMAERGWTHFFLSGQTEDRGKLVRNFQEAEGAAVFLISLKAGGFGLNLTSASYVVLFDPWWNPAVENQAIDRTHRIGQVNKVIAYRLLVKNTIEEKIRSLQKQKSALVKDILGEEGFARQLTVDDFKFLFSE